MAEKVVVELEAKTGKAEANIQDIVDAIKDLSKETVSSNKKTEKSFKSVEKTGKTVAKGIKGIGTAIKAAGIGLLISAMGTVKELFEQNQKAVDFFNIAFETASIVVGQVVNAFVNVYEAVSKSSENFDALGKVVDGLITITLAPFKATFYAIKLGIEQTQLAWETSFFGDKDPETIKRLNLEILETKNNLYGVADSVVKAGGDIVNNFGEAITETAEIGKKVVEEASKISIKGALNTAKANVELQNSAELAAARQGLIFEKFDRQAEKLRQIRDEERNSIADRKKANDELLLAIDEAEKGMLAQAKQQLSLANANLLKDKENIEFKTAQIEAVRELAAVEAQIEGIRSEQKSNDLALDREKLELQQSISDTDTEIAINKATFNAEQIENEYLRLQALQSVSEQEKAIEEKRLTEKRDSYKKGTQAFQDAQNELLQFQQANGQQQKKLERDINKAKQQEITNALGNIAGIVGQNSKFGKAIAVVQALRDTYSGANKALAQGGIFGFIGAAAVIAGGIANVKQITSTKEPQAPSFAKGGGGSVSTPSVSAPSLPPAFNVVGASDTNQLADAIGGQSQKPVKAFVVSNDVTTAQSMDRNIVDGASI